MGYVPGVSDDDEERTRAEAFADRIVREAREMARDLVREEGLDAAEAVLGGIAAGMAQIGREARVPGFATVTEFEAFEELMLESDGPYYLGVSLADTITVDGVSAFEDAGERVAFLETAATHIGEALERERAAAAETDP